ncbi:MAG: cobalamin biosynthesis protein [Pseudobutyrivibrio sp.]|nr:cobalamin biosynthesis protein [Pseudobutyrivibrio sp.]
MLIQVVYFTDNGNSIFDRLVTECPEDLFVAKSKDQSLDDWVKSGFDTHLPIVFICATGIAVRAISPYVENKLTDSPVIVIDELGQFVISVLSGHVGGANALAERLAKALGATPVITTATDLNNVFAIDSFAEKNGLRILDKKQIKSVSAKLLRNEVIVIKNELENIVFEGQQPENVILSNDANNYDVLITNEERDEDCLVLIPRKLILGMGCKKDKPFEELLDFVSKHYAIDDLRKDIYAITSIDVKAKEKGLLTLAAFLDTWLITFSAEELEKVPGDFSTSDFVKKTVGVDNVSERSAVILGATLTKEKCAENGMTLAEAVRNIRSFVW